MAFHLIKGTFHVVGYSPDGDSIRFQADDRSNWDLLDGPPVELNARGHTQLRIEAIDTLETHYLGHHQPLQLANEATHFLLGALGIKKVKFDKTGTKVVSAQDGTHGYILSRTTEKYHRPVSFIFAGDAEEADGAQVFLRPDRLEDSVNYKSALAGLAYPTYYSGLFSDLRKKITSAVNKAQKGHGKGIWAQDKTIKGFTVSSLASVTDDEVILPKLFRRIINFMGDGGGIDGFKDYLAANPDAVLELKTGHFTHLDTFVEVKGNKVKLTAEPENLVFIEK
jgi:endonuclease YncB( thermonuclease family)